MGYIICIIKQLTESDYYMKRLLSVLLLFQIYSTGVTATETKTLVVIAGKPSHPPRMHEFNAGVQLLARCLEHRSDLDLRISLNGWPRDEAVFDGVDAIVFYMDGGPRHEAVQENGRRLSMIDEWADQGVGLGFMHYGVEVVPEQAGTHFLKWIGGHYEHMHSCNPIWSPRFDVFPKHPITRGVKPFSVEDEWYFNMRFVKNISGNKRDVIDDLQFTPILVGTPDETVRDGPYVYPRGPYPHIQANKGRAEAMMWAVERPNRGRGFGVTGGHFHDNWANDNFRKTILNAFLWISGVKVPRNGVTSKLNSNELNLNLDPKPRR